ncbi:hypothetical protein M3Y94_00010400 [Aphelenchoides besseyi]|nr:hypothetical protein M3Y94_00010400 [Aphelenchoides besseyi]KAI6220720.1 hypothetical protein M3Y95_01026000 [Aphelenchoides besseyi]
MIFNGVYITLTVSAFLCQSCAFYVIVSGSPKNMQRYKTYLLIRTVYDLLLTSLMGLLLRIFPEDSRFVITGLLSLMGIYGTQFGIAVFFVLLVLIAAEKAVCLVYRFLVFNKKRRKLFDRVFAKRNVLLIHVVVYVFAILVGAIVSLTLSVNNDGTSIYVQIDEANRLIPIVLHSIFWTFTFSFVVHRVFVILKENENNYSNTTKRLHSQLTWLLLTQAISPAILLLIPGVLAHFFWFASNLIVLALLTQMVINPILTMAFVSPYRRKLRNLTLGSCGKIRGRLIKVADAPNSMSTQSATVTV